MLYLNTNNFLTIYYIELNKFFINAMFLANNKTGKKNRYAYIGWERLIVGRIYASILFHR